MTDGITESYNINHYCNGGSRIVCVWLSSEQVAKLIEMFPEANDIETALQLYLKYSLR